MEKQSRYRFSYFPPAVIRSAERKITEAAESMGVSDLEPIVQTAEVSKGRTTWTFDSFDEFEADYRDEPDAATYRMLPGTDLAFLLLVRFFRGAATTVTVGAPTRAAIESVFSVFEEAAQGNDAPDQPESGPNQLRVFVGHGHDPAWRDLRDHLVEHHGYSVHAFESGARAGHHIRDILAQLLDDSSFALLVLTGDDESSAGEPRARQNVIHETGLFQGRLGFDRAIVLLEEGVDEFSNLHGIQQIRFSKGNIREAFGDVLGTLKREFPEAP